MLMRYWAAFCALVVLVPGSSAQLDSITDQGVYRTFITHLPSGYSPNNEYPILFSMHGLSSNAAQQQVYSAFDPIADTAGFIVVYPNGVSGSWDLNGAGPDVMFLSNLLDTMDARYSLNGCLYYTGMSMGGFMTYVMGC